MFWRLISYLIFINTPLVNLEVIRHLSLQLVVNSWSVMLHADSGYMLQLQTMVSNDQLTMTCMGNGNFRVFSFTNISRARISDLCDMICLWDKLFQWFLLPQITWKCCIAEDGFISYQFVYFSPPQDRTIAIGTQLEAWGNWSDTIWCWSLWSQSLIVGDRSGVTFQVLEQDESFSCL